MNRDVYVKVAADLQKVARLFGDRCNSDTGPTVRDMLVDVREAVRIMDDPFQAPEMRFQFGRRALQTILENVGGGVSAREATAIVRACLDGGNLLEAHARMMEPATVPVPLPPSV